MECGHWPVFFCTLNAVYYGPMASLKLGIALLRMEKEKKVVWAYSANSDSELMFL
jgi:hypothetical protein